MAENGGAGATAVESDAGAPNAAGDAAAAATTAAATAASPTATTAAKPVAMDQAKKAKVEPDPSSVEEKDFDKETQKALEEIDANQNEIDALNERKQ